jgi:SAM-dependent methyltransferase
VAGAYDREIVADAATPIPGLVGTIDLAVSWQVFEHVASLEAVLRNTHAYLKPGGTLVSLFSGRWGAYAVLNRLLPARVGVPVVTRIGQRRARNAPVFSAHYDSCSFAAVRRLTAGWGAAELTPYYRGAVYFRFSRPLMRAYLAYENAVERVGWADVATHYLLVATR